MKVLWIAGLAVALAGCKEGGSIRVSRFTAYPRDSGGCVLVADLVATRDSSNVDVTMRACAGSDCSAVTREMTEGPFLPGRPKTVQFDVAGCPASPDRVEVEVHRWGSPNNALSQVTLVREERAPSEGGGCDVRVVLQRGEPIIGDALVFLVARDTEGRPLDRTLPFQLAPTPGPSGHSNSFVPACESVATVEVQVVT
ncbi:MAG TPA: hypothetical protein VMZ28_06540 [Kofleriaceae bacterium]|nr:hypothetical protein [Kofleriaceae bacterium]